AERQALSGFPASGRLGTSSPQPLLSSAPRYDTLSRFQRLEILGTGLVNQPHSRHVLKVTYGPVGVHKPLVTVLSPLQDIRPRIHLVHRTASCLLVNRLGKVHRSSFVGISVSNYPARRNLKVRVLDSKLSS